VHAIGPGYLGPAYLYIRRHPLFALGLLKPSFQKPLRIKFLVILKDGSKGRSIIIFPLNNFGEHIDPEKAGLLHHLVRMHKSDLI